MSNYLATAEILGTIAFKEGKTGRPAQDAEILKLIAESDKD